MIITSDFIKWARETGPQNCHACFCDPPYHLTSIVKRFGNGENSCTKTFKDIENRSIPIGRLAKGFMNQQWDGGDIAFRSETWELVKKHLLPGAFGMAFAGTRGYHKMAVAIEKAGFIIHPIIIWVFGSGFPKATRVIKNTENKSEFISVSKERDNTKNINRYKKCKECEKPLFGQDYCKCEWQKGNDIWRGHRYGLQALKPSLEMICCFQKPYKDKPRDCIVKTGAGTLNIDGGRIFYNGEIPNQGRRGKHGRGDGYGFKPTGENVEINKFDRWPSNLIIECICDEVKEGGEIENIAKRTKSGGNTFGGNNKKSPLEDLGYKDKIKIHTNPQCPCFKLDQQGGIRKSGARKSIYHIGDNGKMFNHGIYGQYNAKNYDDIPASEGGVSRFFYQVKNQIDETDPLYYCSKASRKERNNGLDNNFEEKRPDKRTIKEMGIFKEKGTAKQFNCHPTVKPIKLNKYLAKLLLPPKEYAPRKFLNPFAGVMSEAIGGYLAGWEEVISIETSKEYCAIGEARLDFWRKKEGNKLL